MKKERNSFIRKHVTKEKIISLFNTLGNFTKTCRKIGISPATAKRILFDDRYVPKGILSLKRKYGIYGRRRKVYWNRERLIELFKRERTIKRVAEKTGLAQGTVRKILYEGLNHRCITALRKELGINKFSPRSATADKVKTARELYRKYRTYAEVGRQMGLSRERVRQLINVSGGVQSQL